MLILISSCTEEVVMNAIDSKNELIRIANKLNEKFNLSNTIEDDYFEPGMMENLDQYMGQYDVIKNQVTIRTEVKGLRYENRTPRLANMLVGDIVNIVRDSENKFNSNNFNIVNKSNEDMGTLPADICNALAPLYDLGYATILESKVSYIERIFERSRYAKQGVLFLEIKIQLLGV